MNKIHLIGRVVHTPEVKSTKTGTAVCNFSLAVSRKRKNQQGKYETDFFDVQAWKGLADLCGRFLEKGKMYGVTGEMQSRTYEKDGVKRKVWEVIADDIDFFLSSKGEGGTAEPAPKKQIPMSNTNGFDPAREGFAEIEGEELPF